MSSSSPEQNIEFDFEFDAPQWADLQTEKEKSEKDFWSPDSETHDPWFQVVHPLHEPKVNIDSKETKVPPRKSVLDRKGNKLSLEIKKAGLSSKQKVTQSKAIKEINTSIQRKSGSEDRENAVKKPRKCWKLDDSGSLSLSPKCSNLPKDMKPKRSSSLTKQSPCSLLPGRCSNDLSCVSESPKSTSFPQRVAHANVPHSPVKTSLRTKVQAGTKANPPKITQKNREKEIVKSKKDNSSTNIDQELRTMLESHNKRILKKQAEYDENGRRIHKGDPVTCPAPTKTQQEAQSTQARLKSKRRSVNVVRPDGPKEAKQKRRSCITLSLTKENTPKTSHQNLTANRLTGLKSSNILGNGESKSKGSIPGEKIPKTSQKQINGPADTENEIKELIAQHNLKLAAKKRKM